MSTQYRCRKWHGWKITMEDAVLNRYNRESYIAAQGDVRDGVQTRDVTKALLAQLETLKAGLTPSYRIDTSGPVEESFKAKLALAKLFPLMVILMLVLIMLQVRSLATMWTVFAAALLGLVGAVPTLLALGKPLGFAAILSLIGLDGILMRNTLMLVDQVRHDRDAGLTPYEAVLESTVRRARPLILTAAATLAFIPHFCGPLAYVLIGGVGVGTLLTLLFLPAFYPLWFKRSCDQEVIAPAPVLPTILEVRR
jgi:multidrug efflux pump subunit AcrB